MGWLSNYAKAKSTNYGENEMSFDQDLDPGYFKNTNLTFGTFRMINVQRCTSKDGFNHPLDGWSVGEWGTATVGEAGEACNIAKKLLRVRDGVKGNKETPEELKAALAEEIADMVIYADLWAASQGINLELAIRRKFNKTSEKIGSIIKL